MKKEAKKVPVVITTEFRGVFFGLADEDTLRDETIELTNARNCLYWDTGTRGFMGLAETGPNSNCRIGATAPTFIARKVTGVLICTDKAAAAWTAFK